MSSNKDIAAVTDIIIKSKPKVENALMVPTNNGVVSPKYMMTEITRKYTLPNLCSCSHKFIGTKVNGVYFDVLTAFDGYCLEGCTTPALNLSFRSPSASPAIPTTLEDLRLWSCGGALGQDASAKMA